MNLNLLILVPILTGIAVLCTANRHARVVALGGAILQLLLSFALLGYYLQARAAGDQAQFIFQFDRLWWETLNIHFHLGVDGISVAMILLTALVVLAGILVSWNMTRRSKEFFFLLLLLASGAFGFFLSLDGFLLFFFLEVAVIPKFLLIAIWGSGKNEYSAMKLALMLMGGSALVFTGLAGLYYQLQAGGHAAGFDIASAAAAALPFNAQLFFFPFLFVGFGVFSALFPFHTWVPDGHSSAPTAASMFLAGISMKLGGYGCLRVAVYLMPAAAHYYSPLIVVLATVAIIYGAFATMMQKDLKYINAYSSVSHCGFVLLGIGILNQTAINGAVMQMVSHGLMTALFFAAIGMVYNRTHTRMVDQLGGLLKIMPFISAVFVMAGLCSLGLPGLSGFVAEMTVFMGAWEETGRIYRMATVLACASIVVTAVYILRAVGKTIMGPVANRHDLQESDASWNERLAAIVLLGGIVVIGFAPFWLNNLITPATRIITEQLNALGK